MHVAHCVLRSRIHSIEVGCGRSYRRANVGDGGRDSYPIHFSERLLREVYFPAFKACIQEGHAGSVMAAYNALDGIPCSANPWLLTDILRKEWGFSGFVVSDYGSVSGIMSMHHVAADEVGRDGLAPPLRTNDLDAIGK